MNKIFALLLCGIVGGLPPATNAAIVNLGANLDGAQEVPGVVTPGFGSAAMTLDTDSNAFVWNISFADLIGDATAAHFHGPAPKGANNGARLNLHTDPGVVISTLSTPAPSGSLAGSKTLTDLDVEQVLAGLWYINIHSTAVASGEIRGQVMRATPGTFSPVPLPAAAWLLLPALGVLAVVRRRGYRGTK